MMKLSAIALAAIFSTTEAFAPVQPSTLRRTALSAVSGDEIREARGSFAAHGTGEIGSFDRMTPRADGTIGAVMGEDVRHARPTYAAHGTGEIGSAERQPFVPHSSTGAGSHDAPAAPAPAAPTPAAPPVAAQGPPKSYKLGGGSWKTN